MTLSPQQVQAIRNLVLDSSISRPQMQENVIDHLCCAVEEKLDQQNSFDAALQSTLKEFAPNGLKEIELETFFILNTKIITMKKLTYISGLLFSISASVGSIFKILHLTGANEFTLIGFGGLALIFAPLMVIVRQKSWKSNAERFRELSFLFSVIFIATGMMLKIFRLAGSEEVLLIGLALFTLGFLPLAFLKMYRQSVAV